MKNIENHVSKIPDHINMSEIKKKDYFVRNCTHNSQNAPNLNLTSQMNIDNSPTVSFLLIEPVEELVMRNFKLLSDKTISHTSVCNRIVEMSRSSGHSTYSSQVVYNIRKIYG